MKKILSTMVVATGLLMAGGDVAPAATVAEIAPVQTAQKDFYVGLSTIIGDSMYTADSTFMEESSIGVQAGYTFFRAGKFDASVEARYTSLFKSIESYGDIQNYGAFVKPGYDFGVVKTYALAGYTYTDKPKGDTDGFAYGIGLSKDVKIAGNDIEFFVDYVINDDSDFDILTGDVDASNELVTVGVNYHW